jgi:hypothetical protein
MAYSWNKLVACTLTALFTVAPIQARADWFQIIDGNTGAYVSNAMIEIGDPSRTTVFTDHFGRFESKLPHGRYATVVTWGDWKRTFEIDIDGRAVVKVHRLR